jgi:two-component system, chemotaxis family, chemotaxis protein CheY
VDLSIPILIVEDMPVLGRLIRYLLKQIGFQHVDVAVGAYTALNRLRSWPYRLVISDWEMKPTSGLDLLRQIRSEQALAGTRFIMMTASTSPEHMLAAKNAGADDFIAKPFTAQALKDKIGRVLAADGTHDAEADVIAVY